MHLVNENWLGKHNEISYRSNNPSKILFAPYTPRFQPFDLRAPLRAMSIVFLVLGSLRPRKGGTHRGKKIDCHHIELKIFQTGRRKRKTSTGENGGRGPAESTADYQKAQGSKSSTHRHQSARSGEYFNLNLFSLIEWSSIESSVDCTRASYSVVEIFFAREIAKNTICSNIDLIGGNCNLFPILIFDILISWFLIITWRIFRHFFICHT